MPEEGNGTPPDYHKMLHDLVAAAQLNLHEHEKIWQAVNTLRVSHLELIGSLTVLSASIRALIDRIPPENVR